MKPDGVSMETTEPGEGEAAASATAESFALQGNISEPAPSQADDVANDAALAAVPKAIGKPVAPESKVKPKAGGLRTKPSASAGASSSHPGSASHRMANYVKSSFSVSTAVGKKTAATTTAKTSSLAGALPKRPMGASAAPATVTNGTKSSLNGTSKKKPTAETVNGAKPKATGESEDVVVECSSCQGDIVFGTLNFNTVLLNMPL